MQNPFRKAEKSQTKGRIALAGPSGSGKTMTALLAAQALVKNYRIALIDTERGSASKYADMFDFDQMTLTAPFEPEKYIQAIQAAQEAGSYDVLIIDSLSHAWEGEGGVLEMHDQQQKRQKGGNSFTAWREVTPHHNKLVNAMIQSDIHLIATMRSKTEYVLEEQESNGKKVSVPKKVGMAPIQRAGVEYEFDVIGEMDQDHNLIITKSRCSLIADAVVNKPQAKWFETFARWLGEGTPADAQKTATEQEVEILRAAITMALEPNDLPRIAVPTKGVPSKEAAALTKFLESKKGDGREAQFYHPRDGMLTYDKTLDKLVSYFNTFPAKEVGIGV